MAEWKEYTVADVISTVIDYRGKTPKKLGGDWSDSGYRALSAKNIKTGKIVQPDSIRYVSEDMYRCWMKEEIQKEDILITSEAPFGQIYYWDSDEKIVLSQRLFAVRINQQFYPKYIYFYMTSSFFQTELDGRATGTTVVGLRQPELLKCKIFAPDYQEQKRIADTLWCLEQKINNNEAINNNLEQQAQLLFKSWFVDFEPFNGTMPSDWEVVPFEKIVDFQNGYAFKSKELLNEPSSDCYQVFKQGHIARGGGFIPDGTKSWYPKRLASKLERFVLKKGDILMAMTDMKDNVAILGNTAIMPIDNEYIVNQRVGHLRANGYKGITYPFIYLLTNSTDFLIDLRSRANSGVQVNLSSAEIKASQTVLPSEKVNTAFSEITLPMFEAIISNQLENQRLAQLRDALLPKLMSGELDVSNIEL